MLYPQSNALRQQVDLSGFWEFQPDPNGRGHDQGWAEGFAEGRPAAVPASWNEQFGDLKDYLGDCWYQTHFALPWGWGDKRILLRFGSVNYLAEVWLNGVRLGEHEGGHLPFEFDVSDHLQPDGNRLVVRVNGDLAPDRVPPGAVPQNGLDSFMSGDYPPANFDFFPFAGIHRPVILYATAREALTDLTVTTTIDSAAGLVSIRLIGGGEWVRVTLADQSAEAALIDGAAQVKLIVPYARLWSPSDPYLYNLSAEILSGGALVDRYTLPIGIRTIAVEGDQVLINGDPVTLRGFGRHEDFPVAGRGFVPVVIVKDYDLMRWVGANSFRTTHYPYSEPMLDLADRLGYLVISETPAVGLFFDADGLDRRQQVWKQQIGELIARDKNHPSVILWSLANEPHNRRPEADACFEEAFQVARALDDSRPVTFVSMGVPDDPLFELCDVICINRYDGWYSDSARLDQGLAHLSAALDALHERYQRPIMVTEFGADAVPGLHADPPEMFSEEYQAAMVMGFIDVLDSKPYVAGQQVWNLCDFKTGQTVRRVNGMNYKGVFTRDRRPKLVAHRLRERWHRA